MMTNSLALLGWVVFVLGLVVNFEGALVTPLRELLVLCGVVLSTSICQHQFATTQRALGRNVQCPTWAIVTTIPWAVAAFTLVMFYAQPHQAQMVVWAAASLPTTMFILPWTYTVSIAIWNTLDGISAVADPRHLEVGFAEADRRWFDDVSYPWKELGFTVLGDYDVRTVVPHRVRWLRSRDGATWVSCETVEFAPGMTFRAQSTWSLLHDGTVCSVSDSGRLSPKTSPKDRLVDRCYPGHTAPELWTTHVQLVAAVSDQRNTQLAIVDRHRVVWFERYIELLTFERMIARGQADENPYEGMELELRMELLDVLSIPHPTPVQRTVHEAQMLPVLSPRMRRRTEPALTFG